MLTLDAGAAQRQLIARGLALEVGEQRIVAYGAGNVPSASPSTTTRSRSSPMPMEMGATRMPSPKRPTRPRSSSSSSASVRVNTSSSTSPSTGSRAARRSRAASTALGRPGLAVGPTLATAGRTAEQPAEMPAGPRRVFGPPARSDAASRDVVDQSRTKAPVRGRRRACMAILVGPPRRLLDVGQYGVGAGVEVGGIAGAGARPSRHDPRRCRRHGRAAPTPRRVPTYPPATTVRW